MNMNDQMKAGAALRLPDTLIHQKLCQVLVLAGAELVLFLVPAMGLCLGFVPETVDNTGMF